MAISILPPPPAILGYDYESSEEDVDSEGDVHMASESTRPTKRPRLSGNAIVTPGEVVTDDPIWMRYCCLELPNHCLLGIIGRYAH